MEICHTQPHLVSPMRLVLYDDLPSPNSPPPIPRPSTSLPSRILADGRQRASSIRDSISLRPKSGIHRHRTSISISGPSDFRRVESSILPGTGTGIGFPEELLLHSPAQRQRQLFRPLQLSIYDAPGHQLPELPSFEEFRLDGDSNEGQEHVGQVPASFPVAVKQPERAFSLASSPPAEFVLAHRSSASFHLPRKPVGSGARRTLSVQGCQQQQQQQPQQQRQSSLSPPNGASCPLIPHFARVSQVNPDGAAPMPGNAMGPSPKIAGSDPSILQDRSEPLDEKLPSPSLPSLVPATPTKSTASTASTTTTTTPPLPDSKLSPVTQWLFSKTSSNNNNSNSNSININNMKFPSPPSSPFKSHFRTRSRTLSGSTLSSLPTNQQNAAPTAMSMSMSTSSPLISKHSHCLSSDSHKTMAEPVPSPLSHAVSADANHGCVGEKGMLDASIMKPCAAATAAAAVTDERMACHPTIYEGEQMQGTFI